MFWEADSELPEQRFQFCGWLPDAPQSDFATVGSGQNDVGALESSEQGDGFDRRHGLGVIDATCGGLWHDRRPVLQRMFQFDR
jgi:hypothetical protein